MGRHLLLCLILPLSVQLVATVCSAFMLLLANRDGKGGGSIIAPTVFCLWSCAVHSPQDEQKQLFMNYLNFFSCCSSFCCLNSLSSVLGAEGKPKWLQWQLKYPTEWLVCNQSKQLVRKIQPEKLFIPSTQQVGHRRGIFVLQKTLKLKSKEKKNGLPFPQNGHVTKK